MNWAPLQMMVGDNTVVLKVKVAVNTSPGTQKLGSALLVMTQYNASTANGSTMTQQLSMAPLMFDVDEPTFPAESAKFVTVQITFPVSVASCTTTNDPNQSVVKGPVVVKVTMAPLQFTVGMVTGSSAVMCTLITDPRVARVGSAALSQDKQM